MEAKLVDTLPEGEGWQYELRGVAAPPVKTIAARRPLRAS
jgi:hypothetical protein